MGERVVETGRSLGELEALRLLVHNSSDMLSRHAPDGTYLSVSSSSRDLLGREPEDLVGRSAYEFFHPDDLEAITASHEQVLEAPDVATVQYRIRHADGHWVWFETTSHTIRDETTGEVVEIHTASRDVTARRGREQRLQHSEEQFRSTMENAPIGIALVDTDGSWLDVNDRVSQIVGRTREELLTSTFQDITHPDDLDLDLAHVQALLDGQRDRYAIEKRYLHADGHVVPILLSVSLIRDADGAPLHFVAQIQDITEQKHHEEELEDLNAQLRESNAELERFAMVASHDLRGPLTTIDGMLDILGRLLGDDGPPQAADVLERARRNATRLLGITDALFELARVEGEPGVAIEVDPSDIVDDLRETFAAELVEADALVEVADLPKVVVDPAKLHVLLQNLLANALKYRASERRLRIGVRGDLVDGFARIIVEDNGRGFAPEDREVMFQPFGRTANGEQVEGAGIGLATCRRIARRYGGDITAEPLEPGARFVVALPTSG